MERPLLRIEQMAPIERAGERLGDVAGPASWRVFGRAGNRVAHRITSQTNSKQTVGRDANVFRSVRRGHIVVIGFPVEDFCRSCRIAKLDPISLK